MHVTDRAHMTCLVFNYSGKHLHFIDGADGGLFLAAKLQGTRGEADYLRARFSSRLSSRTSGQSITK
jgi:hypothetical protein